jgi:hypothetical protein
VGKDVPMETKPQTLEQVLLYMAQEWRALGLAMILVTLFSVLICYFLWKSNKTRLAYQFMSIPVFLTTVPGIFFSLILAYLLIFTKTNLLSLPLFFFFPPIWMVVSLYIYRKLVDFKYVPGFTRISGLALFSAVTFAAFFLLARLRVIAFLWITPKMMIPLVIIFYLVWRFALKQIMKK